MDQGGEGGTGNKRIQNEKTWLLVLVGTIRDSKL